MFIKKRCQELKETIIGWRRAFHRFPELSFQEKETAGKVAAILKSYGLDVRERVGGGYGVIGDLSGAADGPVIALRADMDALPIQEETGLSFASQVPGVMHACGHDGHMAALLGAAAILSSLKDSLQGTVRFIFQPAEEVTPGGALGMIKDGALERVEAIYGIHLWSEFPAGSFRTALGPVMAAVDNFTIRIAGKGGHGGLPHRSVDALLVASHLVMAAQHIVSRQTDPVEAAVITFGKLEAGDTFNVIADHARLWGTARSLTPQTRDLLEAKLCETAHSIAALYGTKAEITYERGFPPIVNHEREARLAMAVAAEMTPGQVSLMPPNMAGEDFAYYLQHVPGAYCFIGAGDPNHAAYPHHHPRFQIEESAILMATEWFCRIALRYVMKSQLKTR